MNASQTEIIIARLIVLVFAFTFHELAHAVVAVRLGDPTPKNMGRVTLNPLAHLDPIGSILILISGFGWAKPVMTNPLNYRVNMFTGIAIVSIVGPISNLLLALPFVPLLRMKLAYTLLGDTEPARVLTLIFFEFVWLNVVLAFFNFLPIPPLDGFKVLLGSVPQSLAIQLAQLQRYGFMILMVIIFILPMTGLDVLHWLVWQPSGTLVQLLLGT